MDSRGLDCKEFEREVPAGAPSKQLQVMAAIAPSVGVGATDLRFAYRRCGPSSNLKRSRPARNGNAIAVDVFFVKPSNSPPEMRIRRSPQVQASKSNGRVDGSDDASFFKEDLSYLGKLGAGSVAGAAAIKYGSIIFPDITRPNILQALIMISTPVIVSVFLLIKQTQTKFIVQTSSTRNCS
ncbi:uncharacterized protein LOC116199373 isoform X2 [Punica granatum]|uniref:Uncharacterized protein LOC116199373 isoform X2 n=1 Tax=Punica granatum TaxID=22663 RepID=A0A6P8CTS5_PUNGR|nr:uncharacterized protein LOC116199373 isoform X2 [Punica granatum]